jgi:uncharacterized membrane protein
LNRKAINALIILLGVPITVAAGIVIWNDRNYGVISILVTVFACVPLFIRFEKKSVSTKELIIIAVMAALSASGRFLFAPIPHFKPVTALVVITAIYFGAESGFVTGALAALVSGVSFGLGPWTPFQMFAWGFVGYLAGVAANAGWFKNRLVMLIYGALSGAVYSMILDIWTTLSMDGAFNLSRYIAAVTFAFPVTAEYAVSNIVFLLLLEKPIGEKLNRIKIKYQIT